MQANLKIEGLDGLKTFFNRLGDSAEKALTVTVNQTAYQLRTRLTAEIISVFDKPKQVTKSAIRYRKKSVSKNQPSAEVYVDDSKTATIGPAHWLWANIHGIKRDLKASEIRLQRENKLPVGKMMRPGPDAKLDQFGNVSSSNMIKMLSDIRAFNEGGYSANSTTYGQYYYFATKHGIFRRKRFTAGYPEVFMVYIRQSRSYTKRFDFYGIGEREGPKIMLEEANKSMDYALRNY